MAAGRPGKHLEAIAVGDPNLRGWWKMDEGAGATAVDWSGYGRHAKFGAPAPTWATGQALKFYINGKLDTPTADRGPATGPLANFSTVILGKGGKDTGDSSWDGLIDEVRLYDKALTPEEIQTVARGDLRPAWSPSPANGAITDILKVAPLTWQAGDGATGHDIYLGADPVAVGAANESDTTGLYRGRGRIFIDDLRLTKAKL